MNEQRQQLDEIGPLLGLAARALPLIGKVGRWAFGASKSAKVARGVAGAAGIASMLGGGGGGESQHGPGGGGNNSPFAGHDAYKQHITSTSNKVASAIDPSTVGHDARVDDPEPEAGTPERPNPLGKYGEAEREKKRMRMVKASMKESWISKIASVARGVGKVAGPAAKGALGAATGKYGRGVQAATLGGAVAGGAALRAKQLRNRKADSQAMYGGGANPNPYARRTLTSRLGFGTASESVDEGVIGTALKGAALAGGAYLGYKGLKGLKGSGSISGAAGGNWIDKLHRAGTSLAGAGARREKAGGGAGGALMKGAGIAMGRLAKRWKK